EVFLYESMCFGVPTRDHRRTQGPYPLAELRVLLDLLDRVSVGLHHRCGYATGCQGPKPSNNIEIRVPALVQCRNIREHFRTFPSRHRNRFDRPRLDLAGNRHDVIESDGHATGSHVGYLSRTTLVRHKHHVYPGHFAE